jgi:16S rRNA C967 or C1407 C5-methylase (RsmB/RsmF family)
MEKISNLLIKLSQQLFSDRDRREQFIDALVHPQPFHPAILWCKSKPVEPPFQVEPPLPWQPPFVDRLTIATRPGQHPLHQEGFYYCLDFSSVFAASPMLALSSPVAVAVDMCASPGGKSLFAWRSLHPQLLISNEVIGKRLGALVSNLRRCNDTDSISEASRTPKKILNLDSKILAEAIPRSADLVLVDAPCSGQSLLAKGDQAPGCFHPVNINKNANRQKRILANSAQLVAGGGYLAYMTCTYSPEENEQVCQWFLQRFPQFSPLTIPQLQAHQSHLADFPCYRLFPQDRLGAGAFTVLLQNQTTSEKNPLPQNFLQHPKVISL